MFLLGMFPRSIILKATPAPNLVAWYSLSVPGISAQMVLPATISGSMLCAATEAP